MTRYFKGALLALLLSILVPGVSWAQNALIVHAAANGGLDTDVTGNLTTHLTGKGFTVTSSDGLPGGSLATYQQIWDVRFNNSTPLSAGDIAAYVTYLQAGGSLFVMGENTGFPTRNTSISLLVSTAGGGTVSTVSPTSNTQTVQAPFTGPTALTTVTYAAASGVTSPPGTGAYITNDAGNTGAAVVFSPTKLSAAPAGTLVLVFDVNFLQAGAAATSQTFIDNLISYLAAPVIVPTMPVTMLMILAALLIGAGFLRLRSRSIA